MLRLLNTPNELLSMIISYLNNPKKESYDKIVEVINESTASKLVPSFVFLGNWLAENSNVNSDNSSKFYDHKHSFHIPQANQFSPSILSSIYKLIGLISLKVPPVFLLADAFDLNWGINQPQWLLHDFYQPINLRIIELRSYVRPFSIYGQLVSHPPAIIQSTAKYQLKNRIKSNFDNIPGLQLELDNDTAYKIAMQLHFKRLILNHASIDFFQPYFDRKNSRIILTQAIIEILKDLNEERNATHEQLLFMFSGVFLYIHAFTLSNQIDGQLLCQFLQSRPYLSPFCLLAIVNHIPVNLYLFNLLTPRALLLDHAAQDNDINQLQYAMFDQTNDDTLNGFISKIPTILSNYFLLTAPIGDNESYRKEDDNSFLSFTHLSSSTLYNKMKSILSVARERKLGPLHVSAMGILLLRCITFSLQRTFVDCAGTKMFTPNFCSFVKTVFAILSTSFSEQLGVKFFDRSTHNSAFCSLTIRGAILHLFTVILHHPTHDQLIPFCIEATTDDDTVQCSHLMFSKLLQCEQVKVTTKIIQSLLSCTDPYVVLEYIDAIPETTDVETCQEYEELMNIRNQLMEKIGIKPMLQSRNVFIIESINCTMTEIKYQSILSIIDGMSINNAYKSASSLCKQNQEHLIEILRFLSMTNYLQKYDFSEFLVNKLRSLLQLTAYNGDGQSRFEIRMCDYALPIAQALLGRLLIVSQVDLAKNLLEMITPLLLQDSAPLHWIVRFSRRFRPILSEAIIRIFDQIVSRLPYADELYITMNINPSDVTRSNYIYQLSKLLMDRDMLLIQDGNVINNEYQSPYRHAEAFAHCSLAFSPLTDDQIAELLIMAIFNVNKAWHKRDVSCLTFARLATTMNSEVAYRYFSLLMENKQCEMALIAGRMFLKNSRIDVFRMICQQCQSMIQKDHQKLDYFMRMIMPSFMRLKGDENVATTLLKGFLESITENSPKVSQEKVIDAVGLVYIKLKLYKSRAALINAANSFSPELKGIIASSLEIQDD